MPMRRLITPAVFLSIGLAPLLWASAPHSPPIETLIEQLGDKDFQRREAASKALATLGVEALPALQRGRSHPDPEVRRRLDELIPPLERTLTLAPKRVTLHLTNKPIREAIDEISKQTGYRFAGLESQGSKADKLVYTFHFDKVPFWQALDRVCEAGDFVLQQNY